MSDNTQNNAQNNGNKSLLVQIRDEAAKAKRESETRS
jgi:hypothetical protein